VLFDLDDTLHDDTLAYQSAARDVAEEVAAASGIDAAALKAAYVLEAENFWKHLDADGLRVELAGVRRRLWQRALERVGITDPAVALRCARRYNDCRKRYFTPFPGALDLLRALRARGKRLGLVTNGFAETHREKIALLNLEELFEAVFIADEVGMLKPDPQLFVHACERLGGEPKRAAMVGDRYDRDIRGAGLFPFWFNVRGKRRAAGSGPPPDAVCTSLSEVGRVLDALG
jgi:HAD superfamily hydrolase (TIGR01509 family)